MLLLLLLLQAEFPDDIQGDLTTAHPTVMADGSLLNFTRTIPNGGFTLFKQDPVTLKRTKVTQGPGFRVTLAGNTRAYQGYWC
jgi:hypothetical protein